MGIIVQIPADITKECTVTKCAAKEFINHVKFNRTINHKLGISAQDMMRGMMKTKFNVDIFSIDIPPFLNNEDARAKAIENIENKRKMNRKGSKEIKLFIPSSGE